ncbi:2'-5' RNA ligase family protein [Micromonospora tulbaghiae]|uniref:2'-5' RNA ligase family protein n=1 Tax=Micromonospora tulbaghiae TaxID=479978 RepID=UPI0033F06661
MTVPESAVLARRDGVELVRAGRWDISTGTWDAAPADLTAAIAALACPAVQKPIVKIGHTDKRFTPGDGEPAIGWYENLRVTDGGHTLIADQVAPAWLTDVQAAAWPNRSIEGTYNKRCGLGHRHPFVLEAVSLLGVTPPGVSTLKPLNNLADVQALFGVAASDSAPAEGEVRIVASLRAAADTSGEPEHTGAMVALIPRAEDAARLAVEGGEPADELHVTLAYLGDAADLSDAARQDIIDAVSSAVNGMPRIDADAFSVNVFNPGDAEPDRDTCLVLGMSGDLLDAVHTMVGEALAYSGASVPPQHSPWHCHMSLIYTDDLGRVKEAAAKVGPVSFDRLRIAFAGQHIDIPLIGDPEPVDDEPEEAEVEAAVAAAAGDENNLREYFTRKKEGLSRWATKRHPWTALYRILRRHVGSERAKRIASAWFHRVFGYWPGDQRHRKTAASASSVDAAETVAKAFHESYERQAPDHGYRTREASAKPWEQVPDNNRALMVAVVRDLIERGVISASVSAAYGGSIVPNPKPDVADRIKQAWNATAPVQQYIVQVRASDVIVMDDTDRATYRVPVTVDGEQVTFGQPAPVALDYVPADTVAASVAVYASREESRPEPPAEPTPEPQPDEPATPDAPTETDGDAPVPPAAEPEPAPSTEPKGEDPVSTLSTDVRSRLGLATDADDAAVLAALADLQSKADQTAEQVAASAADRDEMKTEIARLSGELARINASAAADAKKALFDGAVRDGKLKPADRDGWEARYDKAPEVITEILASIAPNTAVPVAASGYTGDAEAAGPDALDVEYARLFGADNTEKAGA